MAKKVRKRLPVKTSFKKGNTASKSYGRPPMTPEQKELSLKSRTHWKNICSKYLTLSKKEIVKLLKDESLPIIDVALLNHLKNTGGGDPTKMDWILNHVLGERVKETKVNLTGGMNNTTRVDLKKLSKQELLDLQKIVEKSED